MVVHNDELFKMNSNKSITHIFTRFTNIINIMLRGSINFMRISWIVCYEIVRMQTTSQAVYIMRLDLCIYQFNENNFLI